MVFLFQQFKTDAAVITREKVSVLNGVKIEKKETLVIDFNKLNEKLKGGESGYFSNDLAAKATSMKKLMGGKGVSEIALYCVQQFVGEWASGRSVNGIVGGAERTGFAKNIGKANYNVNLNDLKTALVAEFQSYFPKEKSLCKQYIEEKVIPYLRTFSP